MEHRWGQRLAVDIPIRLSVPLFTAKRGRLTNVSLSGGFITTTVDVRVLSRLQVVFEGPRRAHKDPVAITAYVTRKVGHGIGVEWCEFAPAAVTELIKATAARLVQENCRIEESLPGALRAAPATRRRLQGQ